MNTMVRGVVGSALLVAAGASQAVHIIDDFETGSFTGTAPIAGDVTIGASGAGFGRTINATSNGNLTVDVNAGLSTGMYSHSQDAGVSGESSITYDIGGADLANMDAFNAFRLELTNIDLNGVLEVVVDGSSVALDTGDIVFAAGGLPATLDILFSQFAADFSNVGEVVLRIDGNNTDALDATIDNFGLVCTDFGGVLTPGGGASGNDDPAICQPPVMMPTPAGLALLGLGLAGFALRRKIAG